MDDQEARAWLIRATLIVTTAAFTFFLIAPVLGYPLTFNQSTRVLQIVLPVFLGYLGSASHFVFVPNRVEQTESPYVSRPGELFPLLVRGPVYVFGVAMVAILFAFGFSNRPEAPPGAGMSVDALTIFVSTALGVLAAATSLMLAKLFASPTDSAPSTGDTASESS